MVKVMVAILILVRVVAKIQVIFVNVNLPILMTSANEHLLGVRRLATTGVARSVLLQFE